MKSNWVYPALIAAVLAIGGTALCFSIEGEFRASVIVIPLSIAVSIVVIALIARSNSFLLGVMLLGLFAKLFAAWVYTVLPAFQDADVHMYFDNASQLSRYVGHLVEVLPFHGLWGTNLIIAIGACLFAAIGPSLAGAMVIFAIMSFWGQYLFYRTFVIAFPTANRRLAALFLFLFPSLVYWTATFGKDSLMVLAISLISYGIARRFDARGWATILFGLVLASLIRPHIGAFVSVSLFASYLIADITYGRKIIGLKFLLFPLFLATCLGIVIYSRNSLELNNMEDARSMSEYSYTHNQMGGSAFGEGASETVRLAQAPFLMFRPFPWEANNWTAALASCEGLLLFFLILQRRASLFRLLASARSTPLVVFAICFFAIFSVVFSMSISNFGLLARQRVMVLPLVLIMFVASKPARSFAAFAKLKPA